MEYFGDIFKKAKHHTKGAAHFYLILGYELGLFEFFGLNLDGTTSIADALKRKGFDVMRDYEVYSKARYTMEQSNLLLSKIAKRYISSLTSLKLFISRFLSYYPEREVFLKIINAVDKRNLPSSFKRRELLNAVVLEYTKGKYLHKVRTNWELNTDNKVMGVRPIVFTRTIGTARRIVLEDERWFAQYIDDGISSHERWREGVYKNRGIYTYASAIMGRYLSWPFCGLPYDDLSCNVDLCLGTREIWTWKLYRLLEQAGIL